ncbi:MAG: peptidylprolyl isomerase [Chloroflexota bacterium]
MKKIVLFCMAMLLTQAAFVQAQNAATPQDICSSADTSEPTSREFTAPGDVLEAGVDYRAIICTDAGPVYIDLLEDFAPLAVNSFVFLSQQGYYNNTTFHRVIQDFMAQGGDPTATGTGGPGYQFANEPVGFLTFDQPGLLAMANAGKDTNGSQFFITTAPYPSLDYNYTVFGEVLEGQENVESIRLRDPASDPEPGTTLNTVVIITDPAEVQTTYETPAAATQDEISAMLDNINSQLPASLTLDTETSGVFTTAEAAASAPEASQSDYAAFLEAHHHEFRAAHHLTNAQCDMETIPYAGIGFTLDRFATPEDATAALEDGFLAEMALADGYTETVVAGLDYPIYSRPSSACDIEATDAITFWQRGHFVATAQAIFPTNSPAPAERWLRELVGITYEGIFSDALRREIR